MKKIILAFSLLSLVLHASFAQDKKWAIGLELAPAFTWLNPDNSKVASDGGRIKLNGGVNLFYNLTERYALATGIHFNNHGGKLKGDYNGDEITYNLRELEVPIGVKLSTGNWRENMRFVANVGIGLGILFNGSATKDYGADKYDHQSFGYSIFPFRALYNVGAGVEYDVLDVTVCGKINYKGWFNRVYFYDDGMGNPARELDLQLSNSTYDKIRFGLSAIELSLGVIF
ncbi:MAG: PorT family protein [Prevotellaceae bacterium]|jgi:hypothetical protein|nr:PorT family protein [Prevotellaceae bacterium]